jgi:hypothetical protein
MSYQIDPLPATGICQVGQPNNYEIAALSNLRSRPRPKAWHRSAILLYPDEQNPLRAVIPRTLDKNSNLYQLHHDIQAKHVLKSTQYRVMG